MEMPFERTGMHQWMYKRGTFCYVAPGGRAGASARAAVGRIVEVVAGPYERPHREGSVTCYDVRYRGLLFYCQASKLRAISDPDADIGQPQDGSLAA
jgi:hypothetical protein